VKFKIRVIQTRELEGWFEADTVALAEFEARRECRLGEIVSEETKVLEIEHGSHGSSESEPKV
jgi:hypothetical protein